MNPSTPFADMADSFFSFGAFTRVWIALAEDLPKNIAGDLVKIRRHIMEPKNANRAEITFTGRITIHRGRPQINDATGNTYIPMSVVAMEEFGYSEPLGTTIRMTADFTKPNFGLTHQLSRNVESPAEARMLMTLKFSGVSGTMADALSAAQPTVAKQIQASIQSFPFTRSATTFYHVGDQARELRAADGTVIGYLADGLMVPQHELETPHDMAKRPEASLKLESLPRGELDFLMRRAERVT